MRFSLKRKKKGDGDEAQEPEGSVGASETDPAPEPEPERKPEPEPEPDEASSVRSAGKVLLDALDAHVPGAREHADATATYAFATAVELGEPRPRCELIREAARLHDVGKVYVSSALARRPREELLPGERTEVDAHHAHARALLVGAGVPDEVADYVMHVRERFDGRGPVGMSGRAIPLPSRVIKAACVYHEGTRSARGGGFRGEPREVGLGRVRRQSGAELDPAVATALNAVLTRAAARASG